MKKTKLLTSLAALALVLSLGACEVYVDVGDVDVGVDVNPNDSSEPDEGETTDTDTEPGGDEGSNPGVDPNPGTGEGGGSTETTTLSNYTLSIGIQYGGQLVEVPEYATAYIEGSWDSWAGFVALTPSEDGRYEYTFTSIDSGTYEYQLVLAYNDGEPGWTYRITQDGANASFTVNGSEGDNYKNEVTVTSSKALSEIIPDPNAAISNVKVTIDITYNGASQDVLDYGTLWIEGSWDWSEGFVACTVEDGKYVYTFDSLAPIEYEFLGVIYYSDEDLPTEAEGLWSYKVNGSDNCKFTVSDASVSATLVATKALAEILPEKGGDEGEDDDAVIAEAILDAVNEGISWDAFHGEYIDEGYYERETVYLTEDEDGIYGSIIDTVDDEVTFAYYYQDGKDYEYAANTSAYEVDDQWEEYKDHLDEYIEEQLDAAEDFDLDSDTYELKEYGDGYELIFTTDFLGYYEYEYIYIVDEDFDVTALAYGEYFAGDLEGWYAEETTYDKVETSMADFDATLWDEEEEGGDGEPYLLGSFDFSSNEATSGTVISSNDALDEFWTGDDGLYIEARQHDTVYLGNGSGGAYANSKTCIKFGVSGTDGYLQLKFAVGITINKVVVSACSWNSGETDQLKINGVSQDTSSTGQAAELTYEFEDEYNYLLDFEPTGRVTIHAIDIYGTYTPEDVEPITALTLTPSTIEAINVGESLDVAVSYQPTTTIFDTDTLTWTSGDESVATAEVSLTGSKVNGIGSGETVITATAENGVSASVTVKVEDLLEDSETFTIQGLGYSGATLETNTLEGHQANMTVAKATGNNNPQWDSNLVRTYANNTITFTPTYEDKGVTISKIEIVCNGSYYGNDAAEFTDANGNVAGTITNPKSNNCTITIDVTATGAVTLTNWLNAEHTGNSGGTQLRFTSVTIYYNLTA